MAYVESFEHDVFLSYARVDDARGWVSAFVERLRIEMDQLVGRVGTVKIWRDQRKIAGNQLFDRTIEDALATSAVFVALTSRGYLESEYCSREIAHFHRAASGDRLGLAVGDRSRIVNVLLTNLDYREWPQQFAGTAGFAFHDAESDDDRGRPSKDDSPLFDEQLEALADALYDSLKTMKEAGTASEQAKRAKGRVYRATVYLAEVADTLRAQRRNLSDDLKRHEIEVVSGVPPPYDAAGHDQKVIEALAGADLSVHLLDAIGGREIDDREDLTYPRRQVELAGEQPRMIWLPRDLDLAAIDDEAQGAFLQGLERGEGGGAYDFIRGVRADLAGQILEKVKVLRSAAETELGDGDEASCLLVTHDKDRAHMQPVAGKLMITGIEPYINQKASEPKALLDFFEQRLREVGSLIVFYGDVSREWVRERLDTAIKILATEHLDLKLAVFAAPPEKPPKDLSFSWGPIRIETLASAGEVLAFVGGGE